MNKETGMSDQAGTGKGGGEGTENEFETLSFPALLPCSLCLCSLPEE